MGKFLALVFAAGFFSVTASAYPITCRGSKADEKDYLIEHQGNATKSNLTLRFHKALVAATGGLEPGECAFSDRPIRADEPSCLSALIPNDFYMSWWGTAKKVRSSGSGSALYLIDLRNTQKYVIFQTHRDGGCFVIDRVGP